MTGTNPLLPNADRKEWEPAQDEQSLQLQFPYLELRALAQIFVNTIPKATHWLTLTDEERIALVLPYTPNSGSDVYLPYLLTYAECELA